VKDTVDMRSPQVEVQAAPWQDAKENAVFNKNDRQVFVMSQVY